MLTGSERLSVSMEPGRISLQRAIGQSRSALAHISTGHEIWSSGSLTRSSIVGESQRATTSSRQTTSHSSNLRQSDYGCALTSHVLVCAAALLTRSLRDWAGIIALAMYSLCVWRANNLLRNAESSASEFVSTCPQLFERTLESGHFNFTCCRFCKSLSKALCLLRESLHLSLHELGL
jgi:hypothetical protein